MEESTIIKLKLTQNFLPQSGISPRRSPIFTPLFQPIFIDLENDNQPNGCIRLC